MAVTDTERKAERSDGNNVGRIEEIQGVVIEAVFPDELPEIFSALAIDRGEDGTLVLEVQQHLGDDRAAARELARVVRPGGVAIVTVPAFQELWSPHDEALDHQRRYRLHEIEAVLRDAGLTIEHSTYYNFFLFPVVAAARMVERARTAIGLAPSETSGADLRVPPAPLNALLRAAPADADADAEEPEGLVRLLQDMALGFPFLPNPGFLLVVQLRAHSRLDSRILRSAMLQQLPGHGLEHMKESDSDIGRLAQERTNILDCAMGVLGFVDGQ